MAEKVMSLLAAVKSLPDLSDSAEKAWDRYIITKTDRPQSVLISYQEYMGLKETIDLLQRPDAIAQIDKSLHDISAGKRIPWGNSDQIAVEASPDFGVGESTAEEPRSARAAVAGSRD